MKKYILLISALIFSTLSFGQNFINSEWKFKPGDNKLWADPSFDDTEWIGLNISRYWENQGFDELDGYAWYRKSCFIPGELKKKAIEMGGLILDLGMIDDCDEIYLNGAMIANHGTFPPDYKTAYNVQRVIEINPSQILWDSENTLAVRVYDGSGNGGIRTSNAGLRIKGMDDLLVISAKPLHENHIYTHVKSVVVPVELKNNFNQSLKGELSYELISDFGEKISSYTETLDLKKKATVTKNLVFEDLNPGFYEVSLSYKSNIDSKSYSFRFGKDPEMIQSPADRPADFDNYWKRAKHELEAIDPQFRMIYQEDKSTNEREVYLVEMRSLGNILIRGWYARPRKEGVYPAVLHVQGYSTNMIIEWAYSGSDMAVFALNIRGHGNSCDNINPGFPGYLLDNILDKELYIYRGAYMDCIRAVDFLYSRPEVDHSKIAVEGGSQGGALSFATAALDNERIALCVPHVPFLSDFRDYVKVANWPGNELKNFVAQNPKADWETVYNTLSYIDIKNLAAWIKAPVYMSIGLTDEVCPPHINMAAYNQVSSEKSYVAFPWSGHSIDPRWNDMKYNFIRQKFGLQ